MADEHDVGIDELVYLAVLGIVLDELESLFPALDLSPGQAPRVFAERIAARLALRAGIRIVE